MQPVFIAPQHRFPAAVVAVVVLLPSVVLPGQPLAAGKNIALDNFIALLLLDGFPSRYGEELSVVRTGIRLVCGLRYRGYAAVRIRNLRGNGGAAL